MSGIRDGRFISNSDLFDHMLSELLQDYWVQFHYPHRRYMPKVERFIRKKWLKCPPKPKIILRTIELKDEDSIR